MKYLLLLLLSFQAYAQKESDWEINYIGFKKTKIRTGKLSAIGTPRGSILYLEGLGDSMLNHAPLFNSLRKSGYNILAFDYMGQGGSFGKMSNTTIENINDLALKVWTTYTAQEKLKIIGWSTGGLAAYRLAYTYPKLVEKIVLIAPGIAPKIFVGENMQITLRSLTQEVFESSLDPHLDPIVPNSPLKVVPFSMDLILTAKKSQKWKINKSVKGLVLLSSDKDTYVDAQKTIKIIKENASHFSTHQYQSSGSLHELDNEIFSVAEDVRLKIKQFFK